MSLSLQSSQMKEEEKFKRETTVQPFHILLVVYAQVTRLATDHFDSNSNVKKEENSSSSNEDASNTIKRVEEVLNVVKQEETGEDEAKYALRISAKLLSSANSKDSQVILHKGKKGRTQLGGHSIVTIRRKDGGDIHVREWTAYIVEAITTAFNVKKFCWIEEQDNTSVVFYGLQDSTVAAAMSFEAVFNLALTWAANRQNKNCYLLGLSSSIYKMTEAEQKAEEEQAIENEKRLVKQTNSKNYQKKWAQSASSNTKSTNTTDEDNDEIIFVGMKRAQTTKNRHKDVKVEVKLEKDENPSINKKRFDYDDEENEFIGWQSHAQLMEFRKMAEQIADDYFKEKFRKMSYNLVLMKVDVQDDLAYKIGQKDARNVDLKRRRLET